MTGGQLFSPVDGAPIPLGPHVDEAAHHAQRLADLTGTPIQQIRLAAGLTPLCPACQGWGRWHMATCPTEPNKRRVLSWGTQGDPGCEGERPRHPTIPAPDPEAIP